MKTLTLSLALGCLGLAPLAASADMLELAEEKQCLSCHARDDMTPRAPAFTSIAAKYAGSEMSNYLVEVVLSGGEEHWGSATMPEPGVRPEVSEEQARQLVDWILSMHQE